MSSRPPISYSRGLPFQAAPAEGTPAVPVVDHSIRIDQRILFGAGAGAAMVLVALFAYWLARPGQFAPAASTTPAATTTAPRTANQRLLETLGGLSGAHLYQSYLNIGLLADAVENESYTEAQANGMLTTVVGLMDMVDRQLDQLGMHDVSKEDQRDIDRIRDLSQLLRTQVAALRGYWRTGEAREARRYHQAREKAWVGLSDVLGL